MGSEMPSGAFNDIAIPHKLRGITLWSHQAHGLLTAAGVSVSEGAGGQHAALSVADAEVTGLTMATGDELYWLLDVKTQLALADLSRDLHAQILYESGGAAGDGDVDWTLHGKGLADGIVLTDAKASADGNITFPAQAAVGGGLLHKTEMRPLGVAGKISADELLMLAVTLADQGDAAADEIRLIALRLFYTAQICHSSGMRQFT